MQDQIICPQCHVNVKASDFFCYNCGKNLKPKPPSTSFTTMISLYAGTLLLPPLGIIWGFKYLRQTDTKSKVHGVVMISATVVILLLLIQTTIFTINYVNEQVYKQLDQIGY